MKDITAVITGLGVVAANGIGKDAFWQAQKEGRDAAAKIESFSTDKFSVDRAAEIKNFNAAQHLGPKGLRNLDRSALFLMTAAKQAIEDAGIEINDTTTDTIGISTGTTFSHFWPIVEFDREVFKDGLDFANPALFPSTVINASSSMVSIRFNIQGFNTTLSTGYTSGLEALLYALNALRNQQGITNVLAGGVDSLTFSLFFGFHHLGYMAGLKGEPVSCPFDKRRNGPLLGEGAGVLSIEDYHYAKERGADIFAEILGISSYFDSFKIGKIHPQGIGLKKAICRAVDEAGIDIKDIDYVSSCANSSPDLDKIEVSVLNDVFGSYFKKIPVSSIKSMIGETFSASGILQVASCIGAMHQNVIPPTINYRQKDPDCSVDCVPNKAQDKEVKIALVTSFGPGGYNSACVLKKYTPA